MSEGSGPAPMHFLLVHSLGPSHIDDLMELYQHTYWAAQRQREDVERMLLGPSRLFGAVEEATGRLRAFARVISDDVYRAVIFDVVVHPDFRGRGLTRMLFEAIIAHPVLGQVENLVLYCKDDVIELYHRFGFSEDCRGMRLMIRQRNQ